ncbi:MAG: serine hydrolase domain-containing protein [Lysobacterales bacterium]|jgi:beta-lactamase class C
MKTRTLLHLALTCVWFAALPAQAADPMVATPEAAVSEAFEHYFKQHVAADDITGAAFVVVTAGGIVRLGTAGYTDTDRKQPITDRTVFRVASVSKTFAAGLAAVLVHEGRFRWDDRVVDYVPGFHLKGDASLVRVKDLLGQSTGLIPHAYDNLLEDGVPLAQIRQRYRDLSYICPPGDCYSYQNGVFSLIEPVIEKTTAQDYAALMAQKIFRPLEMHDASVGYKAFLASPGHALPHVKRHGRWTAVSVEPNYYRVAPAAGVNASISDMAQWLIAQLGGRPSVLPPATIATLTTPRVKTARELYRKYWRDLLTDAHYGLGWRIYELGGHELVYHSGWVSGFRADVAWSPEYGIGLAVLMNVEGTAISELSTTFWQMAFRQLPPAKAAQRGTLVASSGH